MEQLLRQRLALLDSVPEEFITRAQAAERKAIREVLTLIGELETRDGRIVNSAANYQRADQIFAKASKVFDEPYREAVDQYLKAIDRVHTLNVEYFKRQGIDREFEYIISHGKKNAIKVLMESGVTRLRTILDIAISSGTTIPQLAMQLRTFGAVSSHVKTHAVDILTIIDRTYTNHIAETFGFEWYWYIGGLVKDSRCFCVERANRYFHKSEVEAWGDNPALWGSTGASTILGGMCKGGGRNPLTNSQTIFTLAGGYNCRHIIAPVSESVVPDSVKARI